MTEIIYPIPYRKIDKWGFCDINKNIVINCIFDEIFLPFRKENFDLALVKSNGKYCWINTQGENISVFADQIVPFTKEGISVIVLDNENLAKSTGNCLFIDSKGKNVFSIKALTARRFMNGQSIVQFPNNLFGAINPKGEITIPPVYENQDIVERKLGWISYDTNEIPKQPQPLLKFEQDRYFGFKDIDNNTVIRAMYFSATDFYEGSAMVAVHSKKFYHIDLKGQRLYDKEYYFGFNYKYGLAKVVTGNHDNVNPFVHERWGVEYYIPGNAKWGYIDKVGNEYWDDY